MFLPGLAHCGNTATTSQPIGWILTRVCLRLTQLLSRAFTKACSSIDDHVILASSSLRTTLFHCRLCIRGRGAEKKLTAVTPVSNNYAMTLSLPLYCSPRDPICWCAAVDRAMTRSLHWTTEPCAEDYCGAPSRGLVAEGTESLEAM